jgi:AcrR family transcriptional regulator
MVTKAAKRGVSREQWIQAGLDVLNESGVDNVTIHHLARKLGVSRSGFYWHFKNRGALLDALLADWVRLSTEVITENVEVLALDPVTRLTRTAEMVLDYSLASYEIALRHWALQDKKAARAVRTATRVRLDFVRQAFAELGLTGESLEMRAMLYAAYTTWESPMFGNISRKRRRAMIEERIKLLTRTD